MNLVYGEVVDVKAEDGMQVGTVRVSGAMKKIALDLITEPRRGDRILICDGVAINKVRESGEDQKHQTSHQLFGFRHSSFDI
jgi:HupF/HypC family.